MSMMRSTVSRVFLRRCAIFTAYLLLNGTVGQSAEPLAPGLIQLDKAAYFVDTDGKEVQLQPGIYRLEPLADGLLVNPPDEQPAIALQATLQTHHYDIQEPTAASVSGLRNGALSDKHVLALALPGGMTIVAEGTYSGHPLTGGEPSRPDYRPEEGLPG